MASEPAEERATREVKREAAIAAKVALEEAFDQTKDSHTTFTYIMAFAEAIRAQQWAHPAGDISAMVQELADYVRDCPPDPSHYLEIHDLETLGVDLSFFPD